MAENSKIEWCNHTANLWWGCTRVHAGCDRCYAETLSHRWGHDLWGNDKKRRRIKNAFNDLHRFQKLAEENEEIHLVFVGSMMDIAEKSMPLLNPERHYQETDDLRQELFTQITWDDGLFPNLFFLFLTKRPSNIPKIVPAGWLEEPPANIMWLTSVSDQETADTLIPQLLKIKGKKGLSVEPQIGPIDLCQSIRKYQFKEFGSFHTTYFGDKINWVIQGGESGHHKRPFNLEWAQSMRDQCKAAGVPYFFKQIDKVQPIPEDLHIRQFPIL